ncbi:MAG: helix-turn-helix domain-containing protein [Marinifilaceae bacterium]
MLPTVSFENSFFQFRDLDVNSIGKVIQKARNIVFKPHKSDFYKIFYFEKGTGTMNIDFKSHEICTDKIIYISQEPVYWLEEVQDVEGIVIMFSADFIHNLSSLFLPYFVCELDDSEWGNSIKSLIALICEEYKKAEVDTLQVQEHLLNALIVYLNRSQMPLEISNQHDFQLYFQFREQVDRFFAEKKQISDYSSLLAISERKLHRLTKKFTGKSPGKIIEERIVLEAKRLLSYTNLRNNEISEQLGFNDDSYFIKFFRKHIQLTPKEFQSRFKAIPPKKV